MKAPLIILVLSLATAISAPLLAARPVTCVEAVCTAKNTTCATYSCTRLPGASGARDRDGCYTVTAAPGIACSDDNECTFGDSCGSGGKKGTCLPGPVSVGASCDHDTNTCIDHTCNASGACQEQFTTTVCNDGNPCTKNDSCDGTGDCTGTSYTCADPLDCTTDTCDGAGSCNFTPDEDSCAIEGTCYAAGDANGPSVCQVCDPANNSDGWSFAATTTGCDDADACNGHEFCDGSGGCVSDPLTVPGCLSGDGCCDAVSCQGTDSSAPDYDLDCYQCNPTTLIPGKEFDSTKPSFGSFSAHFLQCSDGVDNDCDELTDCEDPDCTSLPPENYLYCGDIYHGSLYGTGSCGNHCTCLPNDLKTTITTINGSLTFSYADLCNDGRDNDCDLKADWNGVGGLPKDDSCIENEILCKNGLDEDGNGADNCCSNESSTNPNHVTYICSDKQDNDCDGFYDSWRYGTNNRDTECPWY